MWRESVIGYGNAAHGAASERLAVSLGALGDISVHALRVRSGGAAPSGRRLLFLHGFMGAASDWEPVMAGAAACGHECVALDLPGHGATSVVECAGVPRGEMFALAALTRTVECAIDALGWRGCTVVGYSLGARVALQVRS